WAVRGTRRRGQDGRDVIAFHGGARDRRAAADRTLTGLLHDEHAVRTRRLGAHDGGPTTSGASRAASRDAGRAGPPRVRRPGGAGARRLQRPTVAAGDTDDRERQGGAERPERTAPLTKSKRPSGVPTQHCAQNGRLSRPGKASGGEANGPKTAKVRAVAAARPKSNPRHRRFVWRTAVQ